MDDNEELERVVAATMARIVDGDQEAIWQLHELAEPSLRRMVRAEARRLNVWFEEDDVVGLTVDAVLELARMAGAWRPGGALPWVWARQRIAAIVRQHIGQFTRELDDTHLDIEAPVVFTPVDDPRDVLRSLAAVHDGARALDDQLAAAASDRDAGIWLGVLIEKAAGNRSPAVTVAVDHEMQPAAVRKVVQRVSERLAA